jgi:hypothetical protein
MVASQGASGGSPGSTRHRSPPPAAHRPAGRPPPGSHACRRRSRQTSAPAKASPERMVSRFSGLRRVSSNA